MRVKVPLTLLFSDKTIQTKCMKTINTLSDLEILHTVTSLWVFPLPQDYVAPQWNSEDRQREPTGRGQLHVRRQKSVWDGKLNWEAAHHWCVLHSYIPVFTFASVRTQRVCSFTATTKGRPLKR